MENQDNNQEKQAARMSATEIAALLSQTMKDMAEKKTTIRHGMAMSRIAMALAKVIEVADLQDRVELLEQIMGQKKKTK